MDFKVKSDEEIAKLIEEKNHDELAKYYREKNENDKTVFQKAIEGKLDEEIAKMSLAWDKKSLETSIKQAESLNEVLSEFGIQIKKLSQQEKDDRDKVPTLMTALKSLKDDLTSEKIAKKSEAGAINFVVKAVGDMTIIGNVSGGNIPVEDRLSGVEMIPSRAIRLLDLVASGTTSSNIVSWVDQANQEGAPGGTVEGTTKNQIDFDLVVTSETIKKRTAFIKVSTEMLDDLDFMNTLIRTELMKELMKDIENQVYQGDNTGQNLNGIVTQATSFAAGSFAGVVDNANVLDVLTVAANQVAIAEHDGGVTAHLLHPSDITALKLVKVSATDKRYVTRLVDVAGDLRLDGVPLVGTTLVTQGDYLTGVFSLDLVVDKGEITIDIGLDGNDFTKNMRTVLAEWRGLNLIKVNNRTAFIAGDISTDAALLETA